MGGVKSYKDSLTLRDDRELQQNAGGARRLRILEPSEGNDKVAVGSMAVGSKASKKRQLKEHTVHHSSSTQYKYGYSVMISNGYEIRTIEKVAENAHG